MSDDGPFDRRLRRQRRDRAAGRFAAADYLHRLAADDGTLYLSVQSDLKGRKGYILKLSRRDPPSP